MNITSETALSISTRSAEYLLIFLSGTATLITIIMPMLRKYSHAKHLIFLFSLNHNCSLIHLDLYSLLPIATHQGYKY